MKTIPENNNQEKKWDNKILNDLAFIKKHLRYRLNKKTILPFISLFAAAFYFIRMIWMLMFQQQKMSAGMGWFLIALIALLICNIVYKYRQILKFTAVPAPFTADENIKLVNEFLLSQQLVTYRLPGAPEVYQIASRPLGFSKNDMREVMVFIADDNRILINSHFTNTKFSLLPPSRNYKKMANRLKEWLKIYHPHDIPFTYLSHN